MFDFSKIGMRPSDPSGYEPPATDEQIAQLEKHCGHPLPENYKYILKNYNGCRPKAQYFDVLSPYTGILGEWQLKFFYCLGGGVVTTRDVRWMIENFSSYLGPNTLPFAQDPAQQPYYLKWVDNVPQVWHLAYEERDEPGLRFLLNSFFLKI